MVAQNKIFPRPIYAFGNPEDVRETDPDAVETTAIALLRGILHAGQSPVGGAVATASISAVASGVASVQLLAANSNRKLVAVFNTDANPLFLKYGTTATTSTSFTVKIPADGYWEMPQPIYTGIIHGIWSGDGSGSAVITEL